MACMVARCWLNLITASVFLPSAESFLNSAYWRVATERRLLIWFCVVILCVC